MKYVADRGQDFLTTAEAHALTGLAPLTVQRAIASGALDFVAVSEVGTHMVKLLRRYDVLAWFIDPARDSRSDFRARRDARLAELCSADPDFESELAGIRRSLLTTV